MEASMTAAEEIRMDLIELLGELLALAEQEQDEEKPDLLVAGGAMVIELGQLLRRPR